MTETRQLSDTGLETLSAAGVELGEVRLVDLNDEWVVVKGPRVDTYTQSISKGFGVRALVDGAWGYSASNVREPDEVARCALEAVQIARHNAKRQNPVVLGEYHPQVGTYKTPCERDFFDVPPEEKTELLLAATNGW